MSAEIVRMVERMSIADVKLVNRALTYVHFGTPAWLQLCHRGRPEDEEQGQCAMYSSLVCCLCYWGG